MEVRGIDVDTTALARLSDDVARKTKEIVESANSVVGQTINLASPDQVAALLYETLGLPAPKNTALPAGSSSMGTGACAGMVKNFGDLGGTKKGLRHASTSEEDLLKIRTMHPIVDMILEFRALSKIAGTYVSGLQTFVRKRTAGELAAVGISNSSMSSGPSSIHANWNQTVVRTGRLSCSKPNLQNIPNFQTVGGIPIDVRGAFTASQGRLLLGADYSQIEMRVLAHLCRDKKMESLFAQSGDIYRHMAGQVFGKRAADVDDEERTRAKTVCLGVIYGMGPQAMAAKLGLTANEASRIMKRFFDTFHGMKEWMNGVKRFVD
jgi:DNA polymerase-1